MKKLRGSVIAITVIGVLALTEYLVNPPEAVAQAQGPSVTIADPLPLPVRDADHPDRNPFRAELCIESASCTEPSSITAPADKNIVVDVFSGECSIENAGSFRFMTAILDDRILHHFLPERALVGTSHTIYQWNKQTRLLIPSNETFRINVFAVDGEVAFCHLFLSGYTVKP